MRRVVIAMVLGGLVLAGLAVRPASAASCQQWSGLNCGGIQVSRCAWLDYDRAAGLVRAGSNARDEPNGSNYSVAVNDTMVLILPFGGPWTTISGTSVGDYDGWHSAWDASTSNTAGVWCGFQYRALTYHRWTGASSGGEWIASNPVTFC